MRWLLAILLFNTFLLCAQKVDRVPATDSIGQPDSNNVVIANIRLEGNKITKDKIIYREIEFTVGDTINIRRLDSLIVKSSQNLMNRSLFNFVTITKSIDQGKCVIMVNVIERWYIWPFPIFDFADRNFNAWWETRDFNRLTYGVDLKIENFRGRMEFLNFIIQAGYDKKFAIQWTIPYLTKAQVFGMNLLAGYQLNKETAFGLVNNKPAFYKPVAGNAREWAFGEIDFTFRKKYNYLHTISLNFNHFLFADELLVEETPKDTLTGNSTQMNYFSLSYLYKLDYRDYAPYPLKGYYFDAGIIKEGLGVFKSPVDQLLLSLTFDQYLNLYKRWYFAYNLTARLSNKSSQPFFVKQAFGYHETELRGYELYVVTGQHLGMFKSNIKFEIIPRKVHQFKWIKTEKFGKIFYALYANLFYDMGYAYNNYDDPDNKLSNQLLWGTGLGIDFVTYYDLVIRFEYTINKQKEHGFFINLVAPI